MFLGPAQPKCTNIAQIPHRTSSVTCVAAPTQLSGWALGAPSGTGIRKMSNYAVWNTRLRHEWLAKPAKGKYLSKRKRARCGLEEALERKGDSASAAGDASGKSAASA